MKNIQNNEFKSVVGGGVAATNCIPITHCNAPDPECDLDYVPLVGRQVNGLDYAQSNSFAFGGNNAVLVVRRWA